MRSRSPQTHIRKYIQIVAVVALHWMVVSSAVGGTGNYLIVTAEDYAGSVPLIQFADAKAAMGFDVTTYSVPIGMYGKTIKAYIEALWGTPDAPDYILLVGDTGGSCSTSTLIPCWGGGGPKSAVTDLPYACMDGPDDWYPDIVIGRFSVTSVSMLQDVVDKSLCVEAGAYPDPDYFKRALFLAGDLSSGSVETHDWVIENYMDPVGFESTMLSGGWQTQEIADAINNGCLFVTYMGHSSVHDWWAPAFDDEDVHNLLTNTGMYPVILGFSCNNGKFVYSECFAETWQRAPDKGAAAILFPGARIYYEEYPWDECISLEKFFFESFFVHNIWEVGPAWQAATYRLLAQDGSTGVVRDYFEMYNLLGDPALLLPAGVGFSLSVDPVSQSFCSPPADEAVYTIEVKQHMGFDQPVTLTTLGEPAGAIVAFSVNSVPPPFTTVMTVSNIIGGAPGNYSIEIGGTATGIQRSTMAGLNLSNGVPGDVTLISPPDGDPDVPRKPTLTWQSASQAIEYELQVATDSNFTNVVYDATATETSHTLASNLNLATPYYWRVRAANGCGEGGYSAVFTFTTLEPADYSTEQFTGDFDLANFTIAFVPDASGEHYDICGQEALELPTDPAGGTVLSILEDSAAWVNLADDKTVLLYNISYPNFAICDNGGVTFGGSSMNYAESLSIHFNQPRISALFDDLSTSAGGSVSWKQLDDRVAITYDNVPEWDTSNSNTFQIEMFFDGEIHITWLDIDSNDSIVGLSAGNGLPDDYNKTDFDAAVPCFGDCRCLIISEVVQGAESGSCPRWIEITNTGLGDFTFVEGGVIVQMNESSDTNVDVDLSGVTILAGQSYVISSNQQGACTGAFNAIYGFAADFNTDAPFGDGNDRYMITDAADGSNLLDIYGEFGVDGTGQPWEYSQGYAYRLSFCNTGNGGVFVPSEWYFGGPGSLSGDYPTQLLLDNTTPGVHMYDETCIVGAPGDMNCDAKVNGEDIGAFVLALLDEAAYNAAYSECDILNGDFTGDEAVTEVDIASFVALMLAG